MSRFALELVAIEERRCFKFERRLCDDIPRKVVRAMCGNYHTHVEVATHVEHVILDVG